MKLYDTFLLGSGPQDLDLLECRLYELGDSDLVYRHVIVEGDVTFSGRPKPRHYAENADRFARWAAKIRYVPFHPVTDEPGKEPGEAWAREHSSRQACALGLADAEPDDVIIHGDVDEILTVEALGELRQTRPGTTPFKLSMPLFSYAVDWRQPFMWYAPSVAFLGDIGSFTELREAPLPIRELPSGRPAGWHLSSLGGLDAIRVKARSFSHVEAADMMCENAARFYERGEWTGGDPSGTWHDWYQMEAVEVDSTWPKWVYERRCPASWFRPRAQ